MIDKPLYGNPLAGGIGPQEIPEDQLKNTIFDPTPVPKGGAQNVDPIMQGFQNSDFYKNANNMQQDAVYFKYKGEDKMMNSSMAGALKQYLDSIGQGDLYEQDILGGELATVNPITSGNDFMESPDNNAMIPGDPGLYAPPTMKTPGLPPP